MPGSSHFPQPPAEHGGDVNRDHFQCNKPERETARRTRETSRVRGAGGPPWFASPPPPQGGQGLYPGALACKQGCWGVFLDTWLERSPFRPGQRQQAGPIGRCYTHQVSPPDAAPVWWASALDDSGTVLSKPLAHSLHRAGFYIRPLFQDWKRQLFCLTHINKHRKSNKIKRQNNISPVEKQEKSPGEKEILRKQKEVIA